MLAFIASIQQAKEDACRDLQGACVGTIDWADIESLLVAVGCAVIEGNGSRVRFSFAAEVESFHRPHPAKEAKRYQVRTAREFLLRIGVEP